MKKHTHFWKRIVIAGVGAAMTIGSVPSASVSLVHAEPTAQTESAAAQETDDVANDSVADSVTEAETNSFFDAGTGEVSDAVNGDGTTATNTEETGNNQNQTTSSENTDVDAGSEQDEDENVISADSETEEEAETEEDETVVSALEVAEAMKEIVGAATELHTATLDNIDTLTNYIDETIEAYDQLTEEEQELLADSRTMMDHAAEATDTVKTAMEEIEETGEVSRATAEAAGKENSPRYINGVPVAEAELIVETEAEAVEEEASLTSATKTVPEANVALVETTDGLQLMPYSASLTDTTEVHMGIDVSEHQGTIDWDKVKATGIEFAIIRCGYGQNYKSQDDKQWAKNVAACERLGIPYGVYLYSYATSVERISGEVAHTLRLLEGHNPDLPVYFDMEDSSQVKLDATTLNAMASAYCDAINAAGYQAGFYTYRSWINAYMTDAFKSNENYSFWIAEYGSRLRYTGKYDCWQYSSSGEVDGISSNTVDMNYWYGPLDMYGKGPHVSYTTHVQNIGWQSNRSDGAMAGTSGQSLRLEGLKATVRGVSDLGITYQTHVQNIGWQNWVSDGAMAGTSGLSYRLEGLRMKLTGANADNYDLYYCVHVQNIGWQNWVKNGEMAGTSGRSYRLEGLCVKIVPKGDPAPASKATTKIDVSYSSHVQNVGWQNYVSNGALSGTSGKNYRLEGLKIVQNSTYAGGITYRTHVQNIGWQDWVSDGEMSGTSGRSLRLEAVEIKLTGDIANYYDVYYRTHIQNYGWLGWAKNGESSGSEGYSYRMEAMEIVLVPKGADAPGSTENSFVIKN